MVVCIGVTQLKLPTWMLRMGQLCPDYINRTATTALFAPLMTQTSYATSEVHHFTLPMATANGRLGIRSRDLECQGTTLNHSTNAECPLDFVGK